MSYRDDGYQGSTLKIGAMIGTALLGIFVVPYVKAFLNDQSTMTDMASDEGADRLVLADGTVGAAAKTMKGRFQADYAAMVADIRRSAVARDQKAIGAAIAQRIATITNRDSRYIKAASDTDLLTIAASEQRVLGTMGVAACAAFSKGAPVEGVPPPERPVLLGQLIDARLLAMADGRDRPIERKPPDRSTVEAFVSTLQAIGVSGPAMQLIFGERTPEQATDDTICEAQRAMLQAIQAMPGSSGARVYAAYVS